MDPLKVYDIGQQGVQIVVSPLHQRPVAELIRGQNVIYDKNSDAGGLTKRGGLAKLNASALNGGAAINGGLFVAFPDPNSPTAFPVERRGMYLADTSGVTTAAYYSGDPQDWTGEVALASPLNDINADNAKLGGDFPLPFGIGQPGRVYFLHDGTGVKRGLGSWDGSIESFVWEFPDPWQTGAGFCEPLSIFALDGKIFIATADNYASAISVGAFGRVFVFDPGTQVLQQVGTSAWGTHTGGLGGGVPRAMAWYQGRLWVATYTDDPAAVQARIYSIRPGVDEDWTLEKTGALEKPYSGLVVYKGDLYATTYVRNAGTASTIEKLSNGTWSTVRTNASTSASNAYVGAAVLGDTFYVVERDKDGANDALVILTYDGSTFSTSRTLRSADYAADATGSLELGPPLVYDGQVYYPSRLVGGATIGSTLISHDGSTWSSLRTKGNTSNVDTPFLLGVLRD